MSASISDVLQLQIDGAYVCISKISTKTLIHLLTLIKVGCLGACFKVIVEGGKNTLSCLKHVRIMLEVLSELRNYRKMFSFRNYIL